MKLRGGAAGRNGGDNLLKHFENRTTSHCYRLQTMSASAPPRAALPQHFDPQLLAKFYRSMCVGIPVANITRHASRISFSPHLITPPLLSRLLDDCVPFWFPRSIDR